MSPETKISLYNVEAGDQRACVTCLLINQVSRDS